MVTYTLTMPRLGETMDEGRITHWLVAEGAEFRRGEALVEVETDKTVVEFPALANGRVVAHLAAGGEMHDVGAPIARVEIATGAAWPDLVPDDDGAGIDTTPDNSAGTSTGRSGQPAGTAPSSDMCDKEEALEMPRLGETMEEGRIVRWLVVSGQNYRRGEPIVEIETDKTVAEFPALKDGTLVEILREEGEMVTVGAPIARIKTAGGMSAPLPSSDAGRSAFQPVVPVRAEACGTRVSTAATAPGTRPRATPLARKLARQNGLSPEQIAGTGPRGRIERRDVLDARNNGAGTANGAWPADGPALNTLSVRGGELAYTVTGPSDGAPVLLLHGFSADHTVWGTLASALARTGRRVIIPDLPGHGRTTLEAPDAAALGAPVGALIAATTGGRRVEIVAHSMGAVAAVAFARDDPDRMSGLTLIAPAGLGLGIDTEFVSGMAHVTAAGEVLHLVPRISETAPLPSDQAAGMIARELARGRLMRLAGDMLGASGQRLNLLADLGRVAREMPLRVLFGLSDRIIPWQQVAALPALAEVHLVQGAGHMPHWDRPGEVQEILTRAFERSDR